MMVYLGVPAPSRVFWLVPAPSRVFWLRDGRQADAHRTIECVSVPPFPTPPR